VISHRRYPRCPVDSKVPSTGRLPDTPVMSIESNPPKSACPGDNEPALYGNHAEYIGRWAGLTDAELLAASNADPLRFVADHIPAYDRRAGSVAVLIDLGSGMGLSVSVIADAPSNPTPRDCRALLDVFLKVAEHYRREGLSPAIGLLHHRVGGAHMNSLDRRWAKATAELAGDAGIPVLGIAARTESGMLVTIRADQRGSTAA